MNDSYGFFQAALVAAGIVPSGSAETVLQSQVLQALQGVVGSFSDKRHWPKVSLGADNEHDIVFSAGKITDSTGRLPIINTAITKQIDAAWVAGNNAGGLFSGSVAADTTYHLFVIVKDSDLSVDAGFDTDPEAANIPVGYTAYRRIASLYTDASANLVQFYQRGDLFSLVSIIQNETDLNVDQGDYTDYGISAPTGLTNLVARNFIKAWSDGLQFSIRIAPTTDVAPDPVPSVNSDGYQLNVFGYDVDSAESVFDTPIGVNAQIRLRAINESSTRRVDIKSIGWIDDRG